jgi:hypothetical protein
MAILDAQGRLFNKVSILDIGAALVIVLVLIGVLLPSTGIAQLQSNVKPIEVDVVVRSIGIKSAANTLKVGDTTSIVIRNQPHGNVKIKALREMLRSTLVPQPDGSVKAMPDPRPEANLSKDFLVTIAGDAQITKDGPVLGGGKIKIGNKIEIEGFNYDFTDLTVMDIRIGG